MDYSYNNTQLLNISIFSELSDLLPADNWATITGILFDPPHGDVPVLMAHLQDHVGSKALGEQAHKVKGAAMVIGLQRLGELCARIEDQCNADDQSLQFDEALLALSAASHDTQQALAKQLQINNTAQDA
ncbi:MAG: Hpt domain-containing protein [Burkholderiaceae bacterium]|jgi:HPt (histidine-containing phosphotransfer) domain-containing protein